MEKNTSLVKAVNKNVRTSPRKLALVCNFIKGKKADVALRDLEFSRKRIAKDVSKTVKSAISNAENNNQFDIDNLFVKEAFVGKSLVMKRFRPRAKGRASPIKKPFSRITIVLEEKGRNKYTKVDDTKCTPAIKYWKKNAQFWENVRKSWGAHYPTDGELVVATKVDNKLLYEHLSSFPEKRVEELINRFVDVQINE